MYTTDTNWTEDFTAKNVLDGWIVG
jgi:hypothetical protein